MKIDYFHLSLAISWRTYENKAKTTYEQCDKLFL